MTDINPIPTTDHEPTTGDNDAEAVVVAPKAKRRTPQVTPWKPADYYLTVIGNRKRDLPRDTRSVPLTGDLVKWVCL
jgi:hypothetical protein